MFLEHFFNIICLLLLCQNLQKIRVLSFTSFNGCFALFWLMYQFLKGNVLVIAPDKWRHSLTEIYQQRSKLLWPIFPSLFKNEVKLFFLKSETFDFFLLPNIKKIKIKVIQVFVLVDKAYCAKNKLFMTYVLSMCYVQQNLIC